MGDHDKAFDKGIDEEKLNSISTQYQEMTKPKIEEAEAAVAEAEKEQE